MSAPAIMHDLEEVREVTLESAVESRTVELIIDALDDLADGLIVRPSFETADGQTPSIVVMATVQSDADIPGWWKVDVEATLEFRDSELTSEKADYLFRKMWHVMDSETVSYQTALATPFLSVAGIEYDNSFSRERSDDTERRTFSCMAVCGLTNPEPS